MTSRLPLILMFLVAFGTSEAAAQANTHSPVAAGIIEWLTFPTLGYAYAGDWSRGLLPNAVRVGTIVGFLSTYDDDGDQCSSACAVWGVAAVASTVWAVVGAVNTAKDHNRVVAGPPDMVFLRPSPTGGLSVGLSIGR